MNLTVRTRKKANSGIRFMNWVGFQSTIDIVKNSATGFHFLLLVFVCSFILLLAGCTHYPEGTINTPHRYMPDMNQGLSPSQQRAILTGEKPDWSEIYPRAPYSHNKKNMDSMQLKVQ